VVATTLSARRSGELPVGVRLVAVRVGWLVDDAGRDGKMVVVERDARATQVLSEV